MKLKGKLMAKKKEETPVEQEKEKEIAPEEVKIKEEVSPRAPAEWIPKTQLGRQVLEGKVIDIDKLFAEGEKISEAEIVDVLISNLDNEIILIGGSTGKGGGIRRTISKRTARMHKSGRRYKTSALIAVGNRNGYAGLGFATGSPAKHRELMAKTLQKAKLNIIPILRGCGSWECKCAEPHSIPFAVSGSSGSVRIDLKPAPKGIGLCVSDEVKKLLRLAGINDIWCKTRGKTQSRINLLIAVFNALKKLNRYKIPQEKLAGMKLGKIE